MTDTQLEKAEGRTRQQWLSAQLEKRDKLRQQVDLKPEDERAVLSLAKLQVELGEANEFVASMRELCRREPRAWRAAGRALHSRLGLVREAAELLLEVHEADPGNAEVCCHLARLLPGQAACWHDKALRADPGCPAALLASADVHRKAERFDEAARLYKAAHQRTRLGARSLYRLGEALVRGGHRCEGREYLLQVLQESEATCHVHAAVTVALSHVLDQEYPQALEHCKLAEELQVRHGQVSSGRQELKLAKTLKGLSLLATSSIEAAREALRSAALQDVGESGPTCCWDEVIQSSLAMVEILQGDLSAAERHLDLARRMAGPNPTADILVSFAYLRRVQGDMDGAQSLLQKALSQEKNSPLALLHTGYLLLCQERQPERAIQYLQKCLQQPTGTLAYGTSQKGTAHLYLCVAHHRRASVERSRRRGESSSSSTLDSLAQEHFLSAHAMQPCLRMALACRSLVEGEPSRMGHVDLTREQASVVLLYAGSCGLLPAGGPKVVLATPRGRQEAEESQTPVKAGCGCLVASGPTLVGTASTAVPSSSSLGPSRNASDPALLHHQSVGQQQLAHPVLPRLSDAATALALGRRLSQEQVLRLPDIELGECISRGEFAVVHRGSLWGKEVVVKALHSGSSSGSAAELLAEICVAAELSHPRIVTFVGACLEPARIALVTELAPGGNLHQALHVRQRRFSRVECFRLSSELLEGVLYLHSQQPIIAHLDIKSMNLVLDAEGQHLQICDFGLARALSTSSGATPSDPRERPPSRAGSPRYMAPECYDSNLGTVTEKADVWSSACVLIEIFGGKLPYAECANVQQILKAMLVHRSGPCIPSSIEAPVRSVATMMLAFEAPQRPPVSRVLPQIQAIAVSHGKEDTSHFMWQSP